MVLDLQQLDANIAAVAARLERAALGLRIVDKSLPCEKLLARINSAFTSDRFMTFHLPISAAVLQAFPTARLLLGKPMPVAGARRFIVNETNAACGDPRSRIVWLIDTSERLREYAALAEELDRDLDVCFEVDVGLHRGGYPDPDALSQALGELDRWPRLRCRGIMAYEAHIGHVPRLFGGPQRALTKTQESFTRFIARLRPTERDILNLGGSSTALLYDATCGANEVSMGSAFVLPSDFDVPSLATLRPAAFIATPILKVVDAVAPGADEWSWIFQKFGRFPRRGCFLYGGKWMAKPVFPAGMASSAVMGSSTNQQFMALPETSAAKPGDFAFLRPTQSEFVLAQFGPLAVYSQNRIVDRWPVFAPS